MDKGVYDFFLTGALLDDDLLKVLASDAWFFIFVRLPSRGIDGFCYDCFLSLLIRQIWMDDTCKWGVTDLEGAAISVSEKSFVEGDGADLATDKRKKKDKFEWD